MVQEILGSFPRRPWTTSAQVLRLSKMTPTLSFSGGISCRWRFWTMLRTPTPARYVNPEVPSKTPDTRPIGSGRTSSRRSLSRIPSVPKRSARSQDSMWAPLRSSGSLVLPLLRRSRMPHSSNGTRVRSHACVRCLPADLLRCRTYCLDLALKCCRFRDACRYH